LPLVAGLPGDSTLPVEDTATFGDLAHITAQIPSLVSVTYESALPMADSALLGSKSLSFLKLFFVATLSPNSDAASNAQLLLADYSH